MQDPSKSPVKDPSIDFRVGSQDRTLPRPESPLIFCLFFFMFLPSALPRNFIYQSSVHNIASFLLVFCSSATSISMAQKHPAQRLTSPSRSFSLVLHVVATISFLYNFHFLTIWDTPFNVAYGWHFQFLTILGLAAALLCSVLGIVADLTLSSVPFQAKNFVSVVATPLEVVVSILYWSLHLIDPTLLFDGEFQMPLHVDVGFHLYPAVFLALDLVLLSPPWTIPAYGVMLLSTGIAFSYWYWVELCFSYNGW